MIIVRAPVRISFGGGGTDLAAYYTDFDGFVLNATITRYCYVVAREAADGEIQITSSDYQAWEACRPGEMPRVEEPLALPKAAIEWFTRRGLCESGVNLFLASEIPPGTGLGSSSAMTVALIRALAAYVGLPMQPREVAELASWLEIERLGTPIGKQDQYASAFGGVNALTFTADGVRVAPLDLPADVVQALGRRVLLFSTGRTRNSAGILRQQRSDTQSDPIVLETLHQIKALAQETADALRTGDLDGFGRLLDASWRQKRRLSRKVSNRDIDRWYETARNAGALGGRIVGAGGGGFLLLYCPPRTQDTVRTAMERCGLQELAFNFEFAGAQVVAELPSISQVRLAAPALGD